MKRALIIAAILFMSLAAFSAGQDLVTAESAEVRASAERVWSLLADVASYKEWNSSIVADSGVLKGDGRAVGSRVFFQPVINGKKAPKMEMTVVKSEPGKVYELTSKTAGMDIVFGWRIEEKEGFLTVTSYETIKHPSSKIYIALYGEDSLAKNHRVWVDSLKAEAERERN